MAKWSNWSGRQTAEPARVVRPSSEHDFVAAIALARERGWPLRAVGATHSHSRVAATDGLVVETDGWQGLMAVAGGALSDSGDQPVASIRAGTRIFQIGRPLFQRGYGLINQGDIDKQSLAGALSTGTHGTGPTLGSFSTAVAGLRVVLADGQIVPCGPDDEPELFEVARMSLGAVGLITEVDLKVRSRYRLHERQWLAPVDEVMPNIDEAIAATRHFEFFWMPDRDLCACKSLTELTPEPNGNAGGTDTDGGVAPAEEPEQISKWERTGWSHRIISSIREDRHTEMEYSVPAERGPACFAELRDMIQSRFPDLLWPLEYRTLAADDLMISTAAGRPTVTISAHQDIALDDRPLFDACEEIFRRHEGRPHWGKVHYQTGPELAALHPRYRQWWDTRDRFDPDGVFLTRDLELLRP